MFTHLKLFSKIKELYEKLKKRKNLRKQTKIDLFNVSMDKEFVIGKRPSEFSIAMATPLSTPDPIQ